jgi:hypothetical protein
MPNFKNGVTIEEAASSVKTFSAPLRLFGASTTPDAKAVGRRSAAHHAGVFWIQTLAGTGSLRPIVEIAERRAALRFAQKPMLLPPTTE